LTVKDRLVQDTGLHDAEYNLHAARDASLSNSSQPVSVDDWPADSTENVPLLSS